MATIWKVLTRKKVINPVDSEESRLSRVLNTFDLTALGVGSTLGVGVYVLAGHVARDIAGPAVILSFLIAALASVFAGLCYAEFGARAPRAGSAYIYSYVCVGEFVAFVIGWNLILEYVIGSASVARGLSLYLDSLTNNTMQKAFIEIAPINIEYLSTYFDFFAFTISILLSVALAFGLKESSLVNNIFTVLNIGVVLFVIIAGSTKADVANWSIKPDNSTSNMGEGGFFPFGIEGVIKGAATCFYGFVGFDCIATTGEEVKNPKRAIPISIITSLFIIFLAYFGTSTVITLMVPYYLQNPDAPIPYAFEHIGWNTAKWIVSIGGIFGLCASLFGAMFPLPRIIYAMANDSLVFKFLGKVHSRFQTPVIGTLLAGLLTGLMAAMFELRQLVNMMSIGTLLAYTIVAASVLILRYSKEETRQYIPVQTTSDSDDSEIYTPDNKIGFNPEEDYIVSEDQELLNYSSTGRLAIVGQFFNCGRHKTPTNISKLIASVDIFIYCIMCIFIGLSALYLKGPISRGEIWSIVLSSLTVFIAAVTVMSLVTQPTSNTELSFKVPLVPLIPALSILVNIYLMLMLDLHTWIRFAVWMVIGLPTYYFSVRPYTEAQNKNVSNKSSIDYNINMVQNSKQITKLNGLTNVAFVNDDNAFKKENELEENVGNPREKSDSQPSIRQELENNEIQQEIAKLDEMLEEVSHFIDTGSIDRKSSEGTMSNVFNVVSHEESVVALVHHDNVTTPATPPSSPTDKFHKNMSPLAQNIDVDDIKNSLNNKLEESQNEKTSEVITEIPSAVVTESEVQNKMLESEMLSSQATIENSLEEDIKIDTEAKKEENIIKEKPETSEPFTPPVPPPLPPNVPVLVEKEDKIELIPAPPSIPSPHILKEVKAIPRPTSANLATVVLRPLQKDLKHQVEEKPYEPPDDDNLKLGSEKYKYFKSKLTGTLQMLNALPNYIPYIKKNTNNVKVNENRKNSNSKPEKKINENVIEESIDQKEVIKRIGNVISNTRLNGFPGANPLLNKELRNKELNNDDVNITKGEEEIKNVENNSSDNDYVKHKGGMQNVFRSINLKKIESFKDSEPKETRNTKSLGSSYKYDDKFYHRQAMSEIFNSIKLRRKDSAKEKVTDN